MLFPGEPLHKPRATHLTPLHIRERPWRKRSGDGRKAPVPYGRASKTGERAVNHKVAARGKGAGVSGQIDGNGLQFFRLAQAVQAFHWLMSGLRLSDCSVSSVPI